MLRRTFIRHSCALSLLTMTGESLQSFVAGSRQWRSGEAIMPVLFVGHGAPLYTLDDNRYSRAWRALADTMPRPRAVVCISSHWLTRGSYVTAMDVPRTTHDFGRIDDRLFDIQYPAAGDPALAQEVAQALTALHVEEDHRWGLDHGCWCVVRCMYPDADVPILQFSIDYSRDARHQYEVGRQLGFLREKGVLILCSGNIVHNLRLLRFPEESTYDWALEADDLLARYIETGDHDRLIAYEQLGTAVRMSVPTPDHYYPLLYALGLQRPGDRVSFPVSGISYSSTSMRSVLLQPGEADLAALGQVPAYAKSPAGAGLELCDRCLVNGRGAAGGCAAGGCAAGCRRCR
ncbi:MAG: 4,5-DOPA dioxygenase extradiol [Bacteroidia bacterium]